MMTDPIADMLARVRNAALAQHANTRIPASKLKHSIAKILKDEGYIADVRVDESPITKRPELVVALKSGGYNISETDASKHIFGYAVGLDMTRRDLQAAALEKGLPWDATKAFDQSAPVGPITRVEDCGVLETGHVRLKVNGEVRQDADISLMIWKIDEIIAKLSEQYRLMPGDIIMTGTPAGVGAVVRGDVLDCSVDGLAPMQVRIGGAAA